MNNKIIEFGKSMGITGYGNPLTEYCGKLYETITLTNGLDAMKETYIIEVESKDWYSLKCVEVPQKLAPKHKFKQRKEFEETDLISYLTEEAFKVLLDYDINRHPYFETYLRRCLGKKVSTFFRESMIEKSTKSECGFVSEEGEDTLSILDEAVDPWEEVDGWLDLQSKIKTLTDEEQLIVNRLLEGYNSAEISRELETYKNKVRRRLEKISAKLKLNNMLKRNQWAVSKKEKKSPVRKTLEDKRREKALEKLNNGNKVLYLTAKAWGIQNLIDSEMSKQSLNDNEVIRINSFKELLKRVEMELEELENKIS